MVDIFSFRCVACSILIKNPEKRPSASDVLKLPFIAMQMEVAPRLCVFPFCARKQTKRLDELRQESEALMLKHMSPRERMRLRKQQKADEDAKRKK